MKQTGNKALIGNLIFFYDMNIKYFINMSECMLYYSQQIIKLSNVKDCFIIFHQSNFIFFPGNQTSYKLPLEHT